MGHKERLPGRGSSRKGPGVERSLGSTVGGGRELISTSRESLFQSSGLFS